MANDNFSSLLSSTLVMEIDAFIHRNGGDYTAWVVGLTNDVEAALASHGVDRNKHKVSTLNALTDKRAGLIVDYFTHKGCAAGRQEGAGFVYAYRRAFNTTP
ncbi:MAG: hypothetical protein KF696_14795 [Planctomycetes bacterium]|nr:hypothetical protein [Planctomycetota bacterium]MCW8137114.1 hypothetical protein [Planctomycetota bacterium]